MQLHDSTPELHSFRRAPSGESAAALLPRSYVRSLSAVKPTSKFPALRDALDRLGPQEIRRRLWHITPGLLPFVLWIHSRPLPFYTRACILIYAIGLPLLAFIRHRGFMREAEKSIVPSIVGYSVPVAALLVFFPSQLELGLSVLEILAFGDGIATLVGLLSRGAPLPWNPQKTWAGFLAFLVCATPMASLIYWSEAIPRVPFAIAVYCIAPAVILSAVAESLRSRINDNVRVGIVAMVSLLVTKTMFVGWPT